MSAVTIEIRGVDALIARLGKVEGTRILEPPMQRAVLRIQRDMQEYPQQRAGSTYRRTGTLGRKWTKKVRQEGEYLTGRVGNNTSYGPFVQSRQFQARVHRGRWQTDAQVVNRNMDAIVGDFEAAIRRALG
jgi:hypothetical protein